MSIILYHGTTPKIAQILLDNKIDISHGGGEFGAGFYLGTSKRLAKRRAFHKTENRLGTAQEAMKHNSRNTYAVTMNLTNLKSSHTINELSRSMSIELYRKIRAKKSYKASISDYDIIFGIIVGTGRYYNVKQYKFQTIKSENTLNGKINNGSKIGATLV